MDNYIYGLMPINAFIAENAVMNKMFPALLEFKGKDGH